MPDIVGLATVIFVFGIPMLAILTAHHRRMVELKIRLREAASQSSSEDLTKLREDIQQLRETTTQYDLSFDAMLQRLEARIERLENHMRAAGAPTTLTVGTGHGEGREQS